MKPAAVRLEAANADYGGERVLYDVSIDVRRGERVALVGRSGAGKSTLLRLLHHHHADAVALIPQDLGLVQNLTVFHNIYMGRLHVHPGWYNLANLMRPLKREIERIQPIAERLDLMDKLFEPVGALSGGQRQRAAVGRALFNAAGVVLGDEPVSAVDIPQAHNVLKAICEAHETVVLAMHDVELALTYTDRVVGVRDGRIALDTPTRGLTAADLAELY